MPEIDGGQQRHLVDPVVKDETANDRMSQQQKNSHLQREAVVIFSFYVLNQFSNRELVDNGKFVYPASLGPCKQNPVSFGDELPDVGEAQKHEGNSEHRIDQSKSPAQLVSRNDIPVA